MFRIFAILITVLMMGGCVAGQSLTYDYSPGAAAEQTAGTVNVVVRDERPYVKNGDKGPDYVGHYRAGFGNPWDVTTTGHTPFADVLARDLGEELGSLGFSTGQGGRTLQVDIMEWNMDTYTNAKFWYELIVSVVGANGEALLSPQNMKKEERIDGSFWVGPKYAVERQMPELYNNLVQAIVRNNSAVRSALGAGP